MTRIATYDPTIFEVADIDGARDIILTPLGDQGTDERWTTETPYIAGLIGTALNLQPGSLVLDYGCGIGRVSKALIEAHSCTVLGVDISARMRSLAPQYVDSSAFSVVSRRMLERMAANGFRADAAISIWVLQHCAQPTEDVYLLRSALRAGGRLAVANNEHRAVPAKEIPWVDDGIDVHTLLSSSFNELEFGRLDPHVVGERIASNTWWGVYGSP